MGKPNFSAELPVITLRQIEELKPLFNGNKTQIVIRAIAELYKQELHTMTSKTNTANRQQFAEAVARAYVDQFSTDGSRVMNQRIIVFDGNRFASQSSLTPVDDSETVVMTLEDGMFGDVDADDTEAEAWITGYLTDSASNEIWHETLTIIDDDNE